MNKTAFKYSKPKFFKKFRTMNDDDLFQAGIRQSGPRNLLKLKASLEAIMDPSLSAQGHLSRMVRDLHKKNHGRIAGTIYPTPKGKASALDPWILSKNKREIIAHEAWHANVPVLGKSEILAHAYGGWRATKGAPLKVKAKESLNSVKHLKETRPEVLALEVALPTLAATIPVSIAHQNKKFNELNKTASGKYYSTNMLLGAGAGFIGGSLYSSAKQSLKYKKNPEKESTSWKEVAQKELPESLKRMTAGALLGLASGAGYTKLRRLIK